MSFDLILRGSNTFDLMLVATINYTLDVSETITSYENFFPGTYLDLSEDVSSSDLTGYGDVTLDVFDDVSLSEILVLPGTKLFFNNPATMDFNAIKKNWNTDSNTFTAPEDGL